MGLEYYDTENRGTASMRTRILALVLSLSFFVGLLFFVSERIHTLNEPPNDFPLNTDIVVSEGMNISDITDLLAEQHVVRSSFYLYFMLHMHFRDAFVQAGTYNFNEPLSTTAVARAITVGEYLSPSVKITFPEGFRVDEMLKFLPERYSGSDLESIRAREGFLFPDTYFISPEDSFDDIVSRMNQTFTERIVDLEPLIASSTLTQTDVVILASIVEREANDDESMRTVAGILLNRLKVNMPLQVDAAFEYILGKSSEELTNDDLEIESPYNTYINRGLPPTPIANPGLTSILAVLQPTSTDYLYYLTGTDGKFYYARTFEEHKQNKAKYLR